MKKAGAEFEKTLTTEQGGEVVVEKPPRKTRITFSELLEDYDGDFVGARNEYIHRFGVDPTASSPVMLRYETR